MRAFSKRSKASCAAGASETRDLTSRPLGQSPQEAGSQEKKNSRTVRLRTCLMKCLLSHSQRSFVSTDWLFSASQNHALFEEPSKFFRRIIQYGALLCHSLAKDGASPHGHVAAFVSVAKVLLSALVREFRKMAKLDNAVVSVLLNPPSHTGAYKERSLGDVDS